MPKLVYRTHKFNPETRKRVAQADEIIREYQKQGFSLTLRQLYYQFVARDLLKNNDKNYKALGEIISNARMSGLIDWNAIEDRTRNLMSLATWTSPHSIVDACASQFRVDKWELQPEYVEVWIEKEALAGVFDRVCSRNQVPYFSCRGYTSQSEMWGASQRILDKICRGKKVTILHFGDHDPSGIDMTRDIRERINWFLAVDLAQKRKTLEIPDDASLELQEEMERLNRAISRRDTDTVCDMVENVFFQVNRVALNMEQIEEYNPPPNPAKLSDSRSKDYCEKFGDQSWELDALSPATLASLAEVEIHDRRNERIWELELEREEECKTRLRTLARMAGFRSSDLKKSYEYLMETGRHEDRPDGDQDDLFDLNAGTEFDDEEGEDDI